ncbi:MAG: HDOD domain-containing protein [Gammaproteobacteria bacterium]|nr:HDOD domain-containing protein [Gammaproteobacteria bacterium]
MSESPKLKPLFARQPIYNRKMKVVAYELLYRDSEQNSAQFASNTSATSNVMAQYFAEYHPYQQVMPVFVNVSNEMLLSEAIFALPKFAVIELLEDCDVSEQLVARVKELKQAGYKVAIDDFGFEPKWQALETGVDIIKVDIPPGSDFIAVLAQAKECRQRVHKQGGFADFLIEKVETDHQFQLALLNEFDLFQGYFFAKPEIVSSVRPAPLSPNALSLISELSRSDVQIEQLNELIKGLPELAIKLVKLTNLVEYKVVRKISTIKDAIIVLGLKKLRQWALVFALLQDSQSSPAVMHLVFLRALIAEKLALKRDLPSEQAFFAALLASLELIYLSDCREFIAEMSLAEEVKLAALKREGALGKVVAESIEVSLLSQNKRAELPQELYDQALLDEVYRQTDRFISELQQIQGS